MIPGLSGTYFYVVLRWDTLCCVKCFSVKVLDMSNRDRIKKYANGRPACEWPNGMTEQNADEAFIAFVVQQVIAKYPDLYSFDGELKQLKNGAQGLYLKSFAELDKRVLIKDAAYIHQGVDGDYAAITSPRVWFKNAVFDEVVQRVPSCKGVVAHPIMTASGNAVFKRGYNVESGLFVDTNPKMQESFLFDTVVDSDVVLARDVLRYAYRHKAFQSPADASRYIAVLLTAVMRSCYSSIPSIFANGISTGLGEAAVLFYEIDKILHGRAKPLCYIELERYTAQKRDVLAVKNGKVFPVFLGWSPGNKIPQWPCSMESAVLSNMIFEGLDGNARKTVVADFESFRTDVFASLLTIIKAWHQADKPAPKTPSAFDPTFDEWYYYVAGVLEHAGYTSISDDIAI